MIIFIHLVNAVCRCCHQWPFSVRVRMDDCCMCWIAFSVIPGNISYRLWGYWHYCWTIWWFCPV